MAEQLNKETHFLCVWEAASSQAVQDHNFSPPSWGPSPSITHYNQK